LLALQSICNIGWVKRPYSGPPFFVMGRSGQS
jgi:hypothetical protein